MASPPTEQPRIGGAIPRFSWKVPIVVLVILGLTGWSVVVGTRFDLIELFTSTGPVKKFVSGMFPPDLSAATLRTTFTGVLETFQMSFLGAPIGAIIAFPLAALAVSEPPTAGASRGERFFRAVPYHLSCLVFNVLGSLPDILWALVFVVALGLAVPGDAGPHGPLGRHPGQALQRDARGGARPAGRGLARDGGAHPSDLPHALPVGAQHDQQQHLPRPVG